MHISHSLLAVAMVLTGLLAAAPARGADADKSFFPIMAWDWAPNDPAVLKRMHECGITVAGFVAPGTLDAVQAAGMKAIVNDARTASYDWRNVDEAKARQNVESLVAEVGRHPAVFGYYLRDEPRADFFPGLGKVAALIREKHPGAWPYINLFPNYANFDQLGAKGYDDYLEKFFAACQPPIVSYDNYSLMDDGSLRDGYFQNLESVRAASIKHKVPFWNIVLANAHFNYAEPTPAGFRFQAYTTLAYGGRGIAYFTYFAPRIGNYRVAPVDQFGNETPTWTHLRNVNQQILKLAPTLLQLTSTRVYHFDKQPGTQPPPADSFVADAGNPAFMAGEFKHADGTDYVMIVNKSLTRSAPVGLNLRTPPKAVRLISAFTGEPTPYEGEQVWLAPGQGALLRIER